MAFATLTRLSFQEVDATGMPVGEPEIVEQGGRVPDYVRPYELVALRSAGVIVGIDDDEADAFARRLGDPLLAEHPPTLPNPEVPPTLAGNPILHSLTDGPEGIAVSDQENVEGEKFLAGASTEALTAKLAGNDEGPGSTEGGSGQKPSPRDPKAAWEDYAVSQGVDRNEAESMTKSELIAEVEGRENQ